MMRFSILGLVAAKGAFASSVDGLYKLTSVDAPVKGRDSGTPGLNFEWAFSVDDTPSGHRQTVRGFGATVTDGTVELFNELSDPTRSALLDELLAENGAKFNMMRHTIAASEMSPEPAYTYDDANGTVDTPFRHFNISERGRNMALLLAEMTAKQPELTIVGSSWSPPAWMKENGDLRENLYMGNNVLNQSYATQFAQYFVRYIHAYGGRNAKVNAFTIQNQPLYTSAGVPSMSMSADESAKLIQEDIGPALHDAGLQTEIWAYDGNTDTPQYPQTVLDGASKYVKAVAWQCHAVADNNWTALTDFHDKNSDIDQYMTNCWTSSTDKWSQAADFTIGPLLNWGKGVMAWALGTDGQNGPHLDGQGVCETCHGLVVVDVGSDTYELQVDYYMMAQFSKFIPKDSIVLSSNDETCGEACDLHKSLEAVVTLSPDGSRVAVIVNKLANDTYVTLHTTGNQTWSGLVYGASVVTWVLPAVGA
ncbi:glycoside hydrolase family 30 protein [Lasiosphaeria ovina]|uniref:Glycoside hydrolase family 30 protein n=1 Tax=Lasiosphaeria ovina TaxID=92902 RepID=A0AAE0KM09_9PEZI|nr:glycoside hydrolase family 30 protein [Lasiosphaeria ovina]